MKKEKNLSAAAELKLYAENTGRIYSQKLAIYKNLNKHNKRGNFDLERAAAAFMPWLATAARLYCRDFGGMNDKYYTIFPRADRYAAAVALAAEYKAEYDNGELAWLDAE